MTFPEALVAPKRLWCRDEILSASCPVPAEPGAYSWFFLSPPQSIPVEGCLTCQDKVQLYVGISPKKPPANGRPASRQTLRQRIRYHYQGNAEGSTLRLTLGCLLAQDLGVELRRVGSGRRRTFGPEGESRLSGWMAEHAFVTWVTQPAPWELEDHLIEELSLPLNLLGNASHPFYPALTALRAAARRRAELLPVLA